MVTALLLLTLLATGYASPISEMESELFEWDPEFLAIAELSTPALRRRPSYPPPCPAKPNITGAVVVSGTCAAPLGTLLRKGPGGKPPGGKPGGPKPIPALNITASSATECEITITTDGPGVLAFIAKTFPSDAQMTLVDGIVGEKSFIAHKDVLVGIGRASTTFKFSSASGGQVDIQVYTGCMKGCHQIIDLEAGSTGELTMPPPRGQGQGRPPKDFRKKKGSVICETWFRAPTASQVKLSFSQFEVDDADCTDGKFVAFAKSGDPFYTADTEKKCGVETSLEMTSTTNAMNMGFKPFRGLKMKLTYSVV